MDAPVEKFELPPFEEFSEKTKLLLHNYKRALYIAPTFSALCDSIEASSKRYTGKRIEQLQVFTKLTQDFQNDPRLKSKEENKLESEAQEMAGKIIIGSLFYRTWKIKNPDTVKGAADRFFNAVASWVIDVEEDCRLEKEVIYPALFSEDIGPVKKELDALTIVSCCSEFKKYMIKNARYKNYPHCAQDKNLFSNLDKIIAQYSIEAHKIVERFNQLKFLGTFADELLTIFNGLSNLITLISDLPLTVRLIQEKLLEEKTPIHLAERVIYVIKCKEMTPYWNNAIIETQLKAWIKLICSYALYGAYCVLYEKNKCDNFQKTLLKGLNFFSESRMDREESQFALDVLLNFYLKFEAHENHIDWKLYNPKGKVDYFQKDSEAVQIILSRPLQSAVTETIPTFPRG